MKKILKIISLLLLLQLPILHFYIPRIITEIKSPETQLSSGELALLEGIETKYFTTFDGLKLCYNIRYTNQLKAKGTILLLHGIRSRKEQYLEFSEYLSLQGYNSVAIDLRAHGKSEGTHCTFGVKEKKDITALIDELSTLGINENIGVWGQSLGGAVALQATAHDNRIQFAIVESAFTDLETITAEYMDFSLGFSNDMLINYLVYRAGKIANFNPAEASPLLASKNIKVPVLVVHGDKDDRINIKYGRANFKNIASINKKFLAVENANHINVWQVGGEKYFKEVFDFLENR